ncbi:glucosamine-6-phosphate deaminase [Leptolyngbya sp. O-77]|uniref:glucosamine-6-phosphate deaminase n=1 Tax=Leptolyngbya sp. O-77 TaxID=1080068 RepID=UPI00074D34D4|nr:glucosamine-6-phosphate deaminase [Leptolyngbya sp. O-77]BAU40596.1 Glucosamine-6-phosphate deaminase [Leptolyngbya sp. O-77]
MRLILCPTAVEVAEWAAQYILRRIADFAPTGDRPFVLGLPAGSTPLKLYARLIELYQQGKISFQHVVTFNMDEYVGLPQNHPQSYCVYMRQNLLNHIDIPAQNVHILDGNAPDLAAECAAYEDKIKSFGGVNLFIGGVGEDGHIAFNEPGTSLALSNAPASPERSHAPGQRPLFLTTPARCPPHALTVGVGTILDAQEVMILAQGAAKAQAVHHAVEGCINHLWTISALQLHPNALIVCDEDATLELKVKTVRGLGEPG